MVGAGPGFWVSVPASPGSAGGGVSVGQLTPAGFPFVPSPLLSLKAAFSHRVKRQVDAKSRAHFPVRPLLHCFPVEIGAAIYISLQPWSSRDLVCPEVDQGMSSRSGCGVGPLSTAD